MMPTLPDPDREILATLTRPELQTLMRQRVAEAMALCHALYPDLPSPEVWFDLRGKCAGQAHFGRGGLRFNPLLLDDNRVAFLVEVVPHEVAHWLVWHLEDGPSFRPHGREWQTVMTRLFGIAPEVTHEFDTRSASPAPYRYRCDCQEHHFSARRHANARSGRDYRCRRCRGRLSYCA